MALPAVSPAQELRAAIYVMRRDGSQVRKVIQVPGYREHSSPSWSHDGKRLAFDAIHAGTGVKKLFVVNVDGTELVEVGQAETPDWSPDDKQLAIYYGGGPDAEAGICVQNAAGKGRTHIADGRTPRWSPDGSTLSYTDGRNQILLDLLGGTTRDLIQDPVQQVNTGADWSPDGKRMAVVVRRAGKRQLILVDVDGPNPRETVRLRQNLDGRVSWSPDGKTLAISSNRLLYLLDPDGRATRMIPSQKGYSVEPDWSPDGKWITFSGNHPD